MRKPPVTPLLQKYYIRLVTNSCGRKLGKPTQQTYSVRKDLTGLANAALMDW